MIMVSRTIHWKIRKIKRIHILFVAVMRELCLFIQWSFSSSKWMGLSLTVKNNYNRLGFSMPNHLVKINSLRLLCEIDIYKSEFAIVWQNNIGHTSIQACRSIPCVTVHNENKGIPKISKQKNVNSESCVFSSLVKINR